MAQFNLVIPHILREEGGFVNHPLDPGGITNKGITKKTYEKFIGRPVSEQEMRNLSEETATEIYRKMYWDVIRGDALPKGIDLVVMDFAVNSGPRMAVKTLQTQYLINEKPDGIMGPKTLLKVNNIIHEDREDFISDYCTSRRDFLEELPTFKTFGRGWIRRINRVRDEAIILLYS